MLFLLCSQHTSPSTALVGDEKNSLSIKPKQAEINVQTGKFEILENQSDVKVMGPSIFESFSRCLDNALRITKGVLIGGLALFITTIFL